MICVDLPIDWGAKLSARGPWLRLSNPFWEVWLVPFRCRGPAGAARNRILSFYHLQFSNMLPPLS